MSIFPKDDRSRARPGSALLHHNHYKKLVFSEKDRDGLKVSGWPMRSHGALE